MEVSTVDFVSHFKRINNGRGIGSGGGSGYGCGSSGGFGRGRGRERGRGSGNGYGSGYGRGYGRGNGYGSGSSSGHGSGSSDGYDSKLKKLNGKNFYYINEVPTIIDRVKGNIARGWIVNRDLTLTKCFLAKGENQFAHGNSACEAQQALINKLLISKPVEERVAEFNARFKQRGRKYKVKDFYNWHYRLTGSCKMGRDSFAKNHGIDIENDKMTVGEFVELTEDSYGGGVIKMLKLDDYSKGVE